MDNISSVLKGVMCESKQDELGDTQERSIEKLDANIQKYLEGYEEIIDNKDDAFTRAEYAGIQTITSSTSVSVEQTAQDVQSLNKFTACPDLKPKYLKKESNLLEVRTLTRQASLYITAGYKTGPQKKGSFRYIAPLLQQIWITACSLGGDLEERSLKELMKAIEDEAKL